MAYVLVNGIYVATNTITRDGQTEHMELLNIADSLSGLTASVTAAGTSGTNAIGVQGVAGAYPQSVSFGGNNSTMTQLASATNTSPLYVKTTPGRIARLINTSLVALGNTTQIVLLDQNTGAASANSVIYQVEGMSAGQVIDLQIPCANGIGIYLVNGPLSSNIVLLWS